MFPWILLLWFSVISFLLYFLSAQLVRRHHSSLLEVECGSARWLTHYPEQHICLDHCLYLYTSRVSPPASVTQWLPLVMLLGAPKTDPDWEWCDLSGACPGPSIILDVTMVSAAEIPQYFASSGKHEWQVGLHSPFPREFSCENGKEMIVWIGKDKKKETKKPHITAYSWRTNQLEFLWQH